MNLGGQMLLSVQVAQTSRRRQCCAQWRAFDGGERRVGTVTTVVVTLYHTSSSDCPADHTPPSEPDVLHGTEQN